MLEDSNYLGTSFYRDPEKIQELIGFRDPPIGVSLFSGAGGFDLGFAQSGYDVRVMVEYDETACATLRANMDRFDEYTEPEIIQEDIREVSTEQILEAAGVGFGGIYAVFGGPPCQGFSHSNQNRSRDDPRNELYMEMVRVVREAEPVFFVMENVKGLATMDEGEVIKQVCRDFQECGYDVTWDVLEAADYGVPQHRERVFVIGKRVDVMAFPALGNPQMHIGAKPGRIEHPEFFREKHDLEDREQSKLDSFTSEPETLDELLEQTIQEGGPM